MKEGEKEIHSIEGDEDGGKNAKNDARPGEVQFAVAAQHKANQHDP
jgi:hypothetical protein